MSYKEEAIIKFSSEIQSIINYELPDTEKLKLIERYISPVVNKVLQTGEFQGKNPIGSLIKCYRFIITTPAINGKFIVPEHKDIPIKYHGKQVDDRTIYWEQED